MSKIKFSKNGIISFGFIWLLILHASALAQRPQPRVLVQDSKETIKLNFAALKKKSFLKRLNSLEKLLAKSRGADQAKSIVDNIYALYIIDHTDSLERLTKIAQGKNKLYTAAFREKYGKKYFANFKKAIAYLEGKSFKMSLKKLKELHAILMGGRMVGIRKDEKGALRKGPVFGHVPEDMWIWDYSAKNVNDNIYLRFDQLGHHEINEIYGDIVYPSPESVKLSALERIETSENQGLIKEIKKYQAQALEIDLMKQKLRRTNYYSWDYQKLSVQIKTKEAALRTYNIEKMQTELVLAMVDERMRWFNRKQTEIGEPDTPEKLERYIGLAAQFQRDLISIHPMIDGNGRVTRLMGLYYPLIKAGLPLPRLIDPDQDIFQKLEDYQKLIIRGVISSHHLVNDLIYRAENGLPLHNSPELLGILPLEAIEMGLKKEGRKTIKPVGGYEYIDSKTYHAIFLHKLNNEEDFLENMMADTFDMTMDLETEVKDFVKDNILYFDHAKTGRERLELAVVDEDFLSHYGKSVFADKKQYDFKMNTWYKDLVVYRGLADLENEISEEEILSYFTELNLHMASNSVVNSGASTHKAIRKEALRDFFYYNSDLIEGGLAHMATDHQGAGELYDVSYGYSTSKKRVVGLAYAMGAMVVAEYGEHKKAKYQEQIKSRVLVGVRAALKDVDLNRLKQLREDFSSIYPRQVEVMGIGAADPDSTTIVQTIDAKGEVILSYLRNYRVPHEVFVVKGDVEIGKRPRKSKIVKIVDLREQ